MFLGNTFANKNLPAVLVYFSSLLDPSSLFVLKVDIIFEGYQDSGFHSYTRNASEFPSGIYYFNLELANQVSVAKAMLIK